MSSSSTRATFPRDSSKTPPSTSTRISEQAFFIALLTLYFVALSAAFLRTLARWYHYKKLGSSDYFLLFGLVTLTAGVAGPLALRNTIFSQDAVTYLLGTSNSSNGAVQVVVGQMLTWTTMYSVKGGFLMFFRNLIRRVRYLEIYWWIVFELVIGSYATTLALSILVGVNIRKYGQDPQSGDINRVQTIYLVVTITLDAFTDILIVSIPMRMLWSLQMRKLTKAVVGAILSLSVVMVGIAIIRAALAVYPPSSGNFKDREHGPPANFTDRLVWLLFWQLVEADVSVLMLSLTIVRAFFHESWRARRDGVQMGEGRQAGIERGRQNMPPPPPPPPPPVPVTEQRSNKRKASVKKSGAVESVERSGTTAGGTVETTTTTTTTGTSMALSNISEGWATPKRSRSKLVRKNSQASGKVSREASVSERKRSTSVGSRKKKRERGLDVHIDIPAQAKRPRTPRLPTPKLGTPLNMRPVLERSASSQRLIDPRATSPSAEAVAGGANAGVVAVGGGGAGREDYFGHVAMVDFEAVWPAPPPPGLGRKKSREKTLAAALGVEDTGAFMRETVRQADQEERERQEPREDEAEQLLWERLYYDDDRRMLPPPVQRPQPPVRVVKMDAMLEPPLSPPLPSSKDVPKRNESRRHQRSSVHENMLRPDRFGDEERNTAAAESEAEAEAEAETDTECDMAKRRPDKRQGCSMPGGMF